MKSLIKRYGWMIAVVLVNLATIIEFPEIGRTSLAFSWSTLQRFVVIVAPIFVITGLMDVWIDKTTFSKVLGHGSGWRGVAASLLLGMLTAVPLYALLPLASVMLRKGSSLRNVLVFIGASNGIRIPLLLFESASLGLKFAAARFVASLVAVIIISWTVDTFLTENDRLDLARRAENL